VIVGHDWGGMIAWRLAAAHPEVVERLVILNAPHPRRFAQALRTFAQLRRSWYVGFFQLPWLPEWVLRRDGHAALRRVWRRQPTRPGAYSREDVAALTAAIAMPGALTAALNYYRAAGRHRRSTLRPEQYVVHRPTLVVWGDRDAALRPELADGMERWVPDLRVERLPDASHWVMADAPERVNELLLGFLRR
jgi:epoxide hydrolase 4